MGVKQDDWTFRESEMTGPLLAFFGGAGLTCHCEVSVVYTPVDLVAWSASVIHSIEMKQSLTKHLLRQAGYGKIVVDYTWCAVQSKPRPSSVAACVARGHGLLRVVEGAVSIIAYPCSRWWYLPERTRLLTLLRNSEPGGVAGLPMMKGEGPAQECAGRVRRYRETHPGARWREVFEKVPNHYSSAVSMSGALRFLV